MNMIAIDNSRLLESPSGEKYTIANPINKMVIVYPIIIPKDTILNIPIPIPN